MIYQELDNGKSFTSVCVRPLMIGVSRTNAEFLMAMVEKPNEILKCAMLLFAGYFDGAIQFAMGNRRRFCFQPSVGPRSKRRRPSFCIPVHYAGTQDAETVYPQTSNERKKMKNTCIYSTVSNCVAFDILNHKIVDNYLFPAVYH